MHMYYMNMYTHSQTCVVHVHVYTLTNTHIYPHTQDNPSNMRPYNHQIAGPNGGPPPRGPPPNIPIQPGDPNYMQYQQGFPLHKVTPLDSGDNKDLPLQEEIFMAINFIVVVVVLRWGGGVVWELEEEGVALDLALGEEEVMTKQYSILQRTCIPL